MAPKKARRMGSLSSFQPLSFGAGPSAGRGGSPSTGTGASSDVASPGGSVSAPSRIPRTTSREEMPPPPLPQKAVSSTEKGASGKGKGKAKRKSKKNGAEEDEEIYVSSDEEPRRKRKELRAESTREMWTDVYAPTSEADLAPGKPRVAKVREWLLEAVHGTPPDGSTPNQAVRDRMRKYKRILFITGPAGIGKTTTLRVLAEQLGIELVEWAESVEERGLGDNFEKESSIAKFASFLSRHAYPPLSLGSAQAPRYSRPRVLLMTSLPNIGHLPTREAFHSALLSFCKTFNSASCPLVIVHSDSGSGGRAEESWMGRDRHEGPLEILGREVKDGPWCRQLDFLPLAITFMTRALNRVLNLAIDDPKQRPGAAAIQLIGLSANGDLRSAINSLQVLCTGSGFKRSKKMRRGEIVSTGYGRGSRGGRGARIHVSDDVRAALDAVTRREQSLSLFHALGKVFYNKRLDDPPTDQDDQEAIAAIRCLPAEDALPPHLDGFFRRKSMIQMEEFIPTIPVDASTFALWIHHSVPLFCNDIEQMAGIMDDFGAADLMRTDDDIWQSSPQAIAYALHLTVRGTLMGLPSPVPRQGQKVVKPQFFESFRQEKENASLLNAAVEYMSKKAVTASAAFADGEATEAPAWGGISSKGVLATEMVPMALKIQKLSQRDILPPSVEPLALQSQSDLYIGGDELGQTEADGDTIDAEAAGEDGLGVPDVRRWEDDDTGLSEKAAAVGWLEDDDIEDWSD